MSIVNPNKHWEVQSYGMIINKGEIMVNREKLETIVYVFEGKFYVELWDNGYLLHFQEMLGDWNIINSRRDDYELKILYEDKNGFFIFVEALQWDLKKKI